MAHLVCRTPLTLIPTGVGRYWRGDAFGGGNAPPAIEQVLRGLLVVFHALGVEPVVVFADGDVKRTLDLGAQHVDLHLRPVQGLGNLHALLFQIIK